MDLLVFMINGAWVFFFGACSGYVVWSKVFVRIFSSDVNEDGMVVELKKQGCQVL
jgi:hypothetical protein